jgi:hypothetical protein
MKRPCGGVVRHKLGAPTRQPSQALQRSNSEFAALAWCPTVCRGTDDCGENHRCTPNRPGPRASAVRGHQRRIQRRSGVPRPRRGLGSVGDWRFATPTTKPPGVPAGRRSCLLAAEPSPSGPPLGAPRRCLRGSESSPASPADGALGNSEGESGCAQRRAMATQAGRAAGARGPLTYSARHPCN